MTKLLALAAALTIALSSSISTAQAGMRVGIGIGVGGLAIGALGAMARNAHRSEPQYRERKKARTVRREREEKAPVRTAKDATSESSSIATQGDETAPEVITGSTETQAQPENSAIALTSLDDPAPSKGASVETASQLSKSLDCKKFFASVGMTLSVPCE